VRTPVAIAHPGTHGACNNYHSLGRRSVEYISSLFHDAHGCRPLCCFDAKALHSSVEIYIMRNFIRTTHNINLFKCVIFLMREINRFLISDGKKQELISPGKVKYPLGAAYICSL